MRKSQSKPQSAQDTGVRQKKAGSMPASGSALQMKIMQFQREYGNQATARLISGTLQRKAAAHVAQRMGGGPEEEELQLKTDPNVAQRMGGGPEEEELQLKTDPNVAQRMGGGPEEEELQLKADPRVAQRMEMPDEEELQMKKAPSGTAQMKKMPEEVQTKMEGSLGADFSGVNIHEGTQATDVGALAYTQGNDIHFAPGQFKPDTQAGQELLGHELTHVIQQREGRVQPTTEVGGMPVNDNAGLEQEADDLGRKAARS